MDKLDLSTAEALIDFGGKGAVSDGLAQQQLEGTVALHNMLAEHGLAYLADEVGMGKTYIALGVAALMRRFQPALRVLYLLPKNNVRDKWQKDYRSFIDKNYRLHDSIVKGFGCAAAAPYRLCGSLSDLVQAVATDSARDYFICTSAFSLPLGGTRSDLMASLNHFRNELPQNAPKVEELIQQLERLNSDGSTLPEFKLRVKRGWASALNAILPQFDLIVVDEAHNYRRGLQSADRNQLLATVLGTDKSSTLRVKRVLLLSATPFDRDIGQLRRQLELFGKEALLNIAAGASWVEVHTALEPFMVRRLNSLKLGDKAHTRNMYRTEHRSGKNAEITLGLKQKLFAALLQKKVSESLNENNSGKFEMGMLASFESYLPSNRGEPVQFDGVDERASAANGSDRDAPDRTVVELLVNDYQARFHEFPPHPKMDDVANHASVSAFDGNQKQLIFVRRVGSVGELKAKIEDGYNRWIGQYVAGDAAVAQWFSEYDKLIGERQHARLDDEEDGDKANVSSFFAWFYRGNNELLAKASAQLLTTPFNYRNLLASASMMFGTNWATLPGMPSPLELDLSTLTDWPSLPATPTRAQQFERAQYAYLRAVELGASPTQARIAQRILEHAFGDVKTGVGVVDTSGLANTMCQQTLWEALRAQPALVALSREWTSETFDVLSGDESAAIQLIRQILIHHRLTAAVCRLDHPFIDLYALRASREKSDQGSADENLIQAFAAMLLNQSERPDTFSSYVVLRDLAANLDLLLKQNFEDVGDKSAVELTAYLTRQLQPLSPILGATGDNSASRSAIARKFRMPGYPRVLVSTDVFQEGEDLHTFCDSVIHYGISASPISLEQKVGRVDRIASMAHRAMNSVVSNHKDHFIQVRFPHIRESLEFLQVRQAARNLNQFLLSMNRIGEHSSRASSEVELAQQLLDTSPIEAPITELLQSPFASLQPALDGRDRKEELKRAQQLLNERIVHVRRLVEDCLSVETGGAISLRQLAGKLQWNGANGLTVTLRGAHGRAHLLLSISAPSASDFDAGSAASPEALHYLSKLQADPMVRLQLAAEGDDQLMRGFRRNAEIYAGATDILSDGEVIDLYQRVSNTAWHGAEATSQIRNVQDMVVTLCGQHGTYHIEQLGDYGLVYHFYLEERQQQVQWQVAGSYVLLTAQVLSVEQTAQLATNAAQLVLHTLRRNAVFDMVDFHISKDFALSVRALHPLQHLNQEELAFSASMVAVEADRLRQIMFTHPADEDEETPGAPISDNGLRLWAEDNNAMCVIREVLAAGPMSSADLIRQTAYGLGYKRAAPGISAALEGMLLAAARRGITIRRSGMVQLLAHSIVDFDDEHLKNQFLAALSRQSSGLIEREQAIRAFARWMGFARTGPVIADIGASLIRKLLRANRLLENGTQIRRNRVH